jgi:peptidoglycan/LPS O-acetylase OafA/YrhL/lysophospholipase L1-like esterase
MGGGEAGVGSVSVGSVSVGSGVVGSGSVDVVVSGGRVGGVFGLGHVLGLDGLRGVAVVGVLLFHGGFLVGGFLGVDLFFVLSGFLISCLLLGEWVGSGSVGLGRFWGRRARRLLPALFGLLVGVVLYCVLWASPFELGGVRGDVVATVLYVANWRAVVSGGSYWDLFTTPSPLQHTWSLAIEEQFYVVWPLVVVGVLGLGRRRGEVRRLAVGRLVWVAGGLAVVSWLVMGWRYSSDDVSRAYFGTDTRVGSVLVGAVLAAWLSWRGWPGAERSGAERSGGDGSGGWSGVRVGVEVLGWLGVGWLALTWSRVDGQSAFLYRGGFAVGAVAAVAVIGAVAHPVQGWLAKGFSWGPLRWLGLISYGLYLWHWPVFVVLRLHRVRLGLGGDVVLFGVQCAVSVVIAVVSFFVLERPVRRYGFAAWGNLGRVLMPAAAMVVVIAVFAATTGAQTRPDFAYQTTGAADGTTDAMVASRAPLPTVPDAADASTAVPSTAGPVGAAGPPTVSHDPIPRPVARKPRLLVVGDSVAYYLGEGMQHQPALGVDVGNSAMFKCTLGRQWSDWERPGVMGQGTFIDKEDAACRRWPEHWQNDINTFRPDAVFFHFGGSPQGRLDIDGTFYAPCSAEYRAYQRQEVEVAIGILTARGATLFLVPSAHPRFPFLQEDIDQRTDCVNQIYRDAAADHPANVRILAFDEWVCPPPGVQCQEMVDGVNMREDGVHFRGPGAEAAARWIVPHLFTTDQGAGPAPG